MYSIAYTTNFVRKYKALVKNNRSLAIKIDSAVEAMRVNPHNPKLKSHRVGHDRLYGALWSSRVTGDIRIIWFCDKNDTMLLLLVNVGGHDKVY